MGGGKGQSKQSIPQWAQLAGESIFGGPGFSQGGGASGGLFGDSYGQQQYNGPAGDLVGGFQGASPEQLYSGLGQLPGMAAQLGPAYAQAGAAGSANAAGANQLLGGAGMQGAGTSAGLNAMTPQFLQQAQPFLSALSSMVGGSGTGAFSGSVTPAALGQMGSMDPNGDLYNRAMALMKPQVRSSYAARGLAGSGAAVGAETQAATQLADQLAQQSAQNKIGLLGQAAAGEGANASMTGALGSQLAARMQGALGGAQAPSSIFGQLQQGVGQGIGNFGQAATVNASPLTALLQGQNLSTQGLQMAPAISNQVYAATRAPYLGLLQAVSGASGLSHPAGKVK